MRNHFNSLDDSEGSETDCNMEATCSKSNQSTDPLEDEEDGEAFTQSASNEHTLKENEDSMEMTVTRLVTLDGMLFSVFVKSEDLIYLFSESGYILPTSTDAIKKIVLNVGEKAKIKVEQRFKQLKSEGLKFSLTTDEWISTRNKRYLNIKLHSPHLGEAQNHISLGLVRITGSATAIKYKSIIEERLKMFGICYDDVIGLTTDGSSVMLNIGQGLPIYHQLCYAHGLQLAILDFLYKRDTVFNKVFNEVNIKFKTSKTCVDDTDDDSDSESEDDGLEVLSPAVRYHPLENTNYEPLIEKVRKVVKMCRNSPINDVLKQHVKDDFGEEICLIIDCKTKWSTMCSMMERFIMLYPSVQKVLIDINSDVQFDSSELFLMKQIHMALDVVRTTVEVLCQEDTTLLTADTALKQMFEKLKNMPGYSAANLLSALRKRISERYLLTQGVLSYLHSAKEFFEDCPPDVFYKPSPDVIKTVIAALVTEPSTSTSDAQSTAVPLVTFKIFQEDRIQKLASPSGNLETPAPSTSTQEEKKCLPQMILEEMDFYEKGGERGKFLSKAYQQLLTIKPTSVQSEQAFSNAGYYCNKFRSSLSDSTLDTIMFLRSYLNMMLKNV